MAHPKVDPKLIHLLRVNIIKERLETSLEFLEEPSTIDDYILGHEYTQMVNPESNGFKARLFLTLKPIDENDGPIGIEAEYGLEFEFQIDNLHGFIEVDEDQVSLNGPLFPTLAGICYSTARGIIMEKLSGSFFSQMLLPVINPANLLTNKSLR